MCAPSLISDLYSFSFSLIESKSSVPFSLLVGILRALARIGLMTNSLFSLTPQPAHYYGLSWTV